MSETEQPIRQAPARRQCLCVLITEAAHVGGRPALNPCGSTMTNPDAPLCTDCTDAGHEDQDHLPYAEVAAARQEGRLIP